MLPVHRNGKVQSAVYTILLLGTLYSSFAFMFDYFKPKTTFHIVLTGMSVIATGATIFHLFYIWLYYAEPESFMKYRSNDRPFPWKENPEWWNERKMKYALGYVMIFIF